MICICKYSIKYEYLYLYTGLQPDTVVANISGSIRDFWGLLNDQGYILNWNGEISPLIHQLDHFLGELEEITDSKNNGIKDVERIHNRFVFVRTYFGFFCRNLSRFDVFYGNFYIAYLIIIIYL